MHDLPKLTRKLTLETPTDAPDGAGGTVAGWTPLGTLWAEMSARAGRLAVDDLAPVSTVTWRIVVRAQPPGSVARPRAGQRLIEGARRFAITAVADWGSAGRYLVLFATEEVAP